MKLKNQLLALSALTLLLPWSGWKLLQELEHFLRETQESAMLASARTLAGALPLEFQSRLLFAPDLYLPLREFERPPILDGYSDDWPDASEGLDFQSRDGELQVSLLAGSFDGQLYLMFDVHGRAPQHALPGAGQADGIQLFSRNPRGLFSFSIRPEAPGPLQLHSEVAGGGQVEGYWLDGGSSYRVELSLAASAQNSDISFEVRDGGRGDAGMPVRVAGPMGDGVRRQWISMLGKWNGLAEWFAASAPDSTRTLLVDQQGWVLADSGVRQAPGSQVTTWLQRLLYRLVAGSRTALLDEWPDQPVRLSDQLVQQALAGGEAVGWSQDLDTAVVRNAVAVPLELEGGIMGAIVLQSASEGLLLVTNRALGRLLFTTLALTFGLAAGLWFFATRLSQRVRRLSGAVSLAMEDGVDPDLLPLVAEKDELGELARNNQKLLRAVADYNQYLQTLAGKLSHELKTPLAITRSSLDNLSSQDLEPEARRYLERALEGLERQAVIVRAMSEASRLEASISVAEWEEVDLLSLLSNCAEAYVSLHAKRKLQTEFPAGPAPFTCAPELLAQALDKLVDNAMSLSGEEDTVTLSFSKTAANYLIAVRNTGTRLPGEFQDKLFDSLVSLREKRGSAPHLGLGLYIVRLVAAAHHGVVEARNLPQDGGVEFLISLPISGAPVV
jgi:two-component system sensor histidine kinase ChvG